MASKMLLVLHARISSAVAETALELTSPIDTRATYAERTLGGFEPYPEGCSCEGDDLVFPPDNSWAWCPQSSFFAHIDV